MNQAFSALPSLENTALAGRAVLVRLDLDLPSDSEGNLELFRLTSALPTLQKCLKEALSVTVMGHRGRPQGRQPSLSLRPIAEHLGRVLSCPITFVDNFVKSPRVKSEQSGEKVLNLTVLENLRFWPGETADEAEFARILAGFGDLYVNESFATAHRRQASVTTLPHLLPTVFGYQFLKEVEAVSKVLVSPRHPIVVVLGGAKADKLEMLPGLLKLADQVLLGGSLPKFSPTPDPKLVLGQLNETGLDLTPASAEQFAQIISQAGTVIWNGPVGKFEDEANLLGTKIVAESVAATSAFTLVGGGDTWAALVKLNLTDKIKHLSTGGGALMELLATGTLPALEAVRKQ